MAKSLVLNATYEPLCVVAVRRAVVLVLKEKAQLVHATDQRLHSEKLAMPVPSVVRLNYFVKVPFQARVALNRKAVFARDGHRCQYCGIAAENLDHVVPRSRGGPHTWENVVASCRSCNARKEARLPNECGMVLRRPPVAPHATTSLIASAGPIDPVWHKYLGRAEAVSA